MKAYLITILIFISLSLSAQAPKPNLSNENRDSIINLLEEQVSITKNQLRNTDSIRVDLRNQLIIYKAKEDYFAVALEDQSNRFALIITGLLGLLALVSFSWYVIAKREINKRFTKFTKEFEQMKIENKKLEIGLSLTAGNSFVLIAKTQESKNDFVGAFDYSLMTVKQSCKGNILLEAEDYDFKVEIANLKTAIRHLDKIKSDPKYKEQLAKKKESVIEKLNYISETNNEEIKDYCAEIRISMKNYLK